MEGAVKQNENQKARPQSKHISEYLDDWISGSINNMEESGQIYPHPLDRQIDWSKNYGVGLQFNDFGGLVVPNGATKNIMKGLAKQFFFLICTTSKKLLHHYSCKQGVQLNLYETCALLEMMRRYAISEHRYLTKDEPLAIYLKIKDLIAKNQGTKLTKSENTTLFEVWLAMPKLQIDTTESDLLSDSDSNGPEVIDMSSPPRSKSTPQVKTLGSPKETANSFKLKPQPKHQLQSQPAIGTTPKWNDKEIAAQTTDTISNNQLNIKPHQGQCFKGKCAECEKYYNSMRFALGTLQWKINAILETTFPTCNLENKNSSHNTIEKFQILADKIEQSQKDRELEVQNAMMHLKNAEIARAAAKQRADTLYNELRDGQTIVDHLRKNLIKTQQKAEDDLRIEKESYVRLKERHSQKIIKLENELAEARAETTDIKNKAKHYKITVDTKMHKLKDEALSWKRKLEAELSSKATLQLDIDATEEILKVVREDKLRLQEYNSQMAVREQELRSELAALRSTRSNAETEKDTRERAVREAHEQDQRKFDEAMAQKIGDNEALKAHLETEKLARADLEIQLISVRGLILAASHVQL